MVAWLRDLEELRAVLGGAGLMGLVSDLVGDNSEANTQLFRLAGNLAFDNGKISSLITLCTLPRLTVPD